MQYVCIFQQRGSGSYYRQGQADRAGDHGSEKFLPSEKNVSYGRNGSNQIFIEDISNKFSKTPIF